MPSLKQSEARTEYVAEYVLDQLGDRHSERFYRFVAAKVPETAIRKMISEIKVDGAEYPAKLFTHKVKLYGERKKGS